MKKKAKERTSPQLPRLGAAPRRSSSLQDAASLEDPLSIEADRNPLRKAFRRVKSRIKPERSLLYFHPDNRFRQWVQSIILSRSFTTIVTLAILGNAITLALYDPLNDNNPINEMADNLDNLWLAIYTLEMFLKIIAQGLILHPNAYLRDAWGCFDAVLVISGYVAFAGGVNVTGLRTLRILRPLRMVASVMELRVIVSSLLAAVPQLMNVMLLYLFFVLLMGIIGMQLFGGVFRNRCVSVDTGTVLDTLADKCCSLVSGSGFQCPLGSICTADVGENPSYGFASFDDIGSTLFMLFQVITFDNWGDYYYRLMDAYSTGTAAYWILLILFGSYFIISLALVIVKDSFEKNELLEREKALASVSSSLQFLSTFRLSSSSSFSSLSSLDSASSASSRILSCLSSCLSRLHRISFSSIKSKFSAFASRLYNRTSALFHRIPGVKSLRKAASFVADSPRFSHLVTLVIVINTLFMASTHYPSDPEFDGVLDSANVCFTWFFAAECIIKLVAWGPVVYFGSQQNVFDFLLVVSGVSDLFLEGDTNFTALRSIRTLRVFRAIRSWKSLQQLMDSVVHAIKSIAYFVALVFCILFIFTLLSMQLFGGKFSFPDGTPRENFDSLFRAFLTTFMNFSGENWSAVSFNAMRATSPVAAVFFVAEFIISTYLLLNLFVAILLGSLSRPEEPNNNGSDGDASSGGKDNRTILQRAANGFRSAGRSFTNFVRIISGKSSGGGGGSSIATNSQMILKRNSSLMTTFNVNVENRAVIKLREQSLQRQQQQQQQASLAWLSPSSSAKRSVPSLPSPFGALKDKSSSSADLLQTSPPSSPLKSPSKYRKGEDNDDNNNGTFITHFGVIGEPLSPKKSPSSSAASGPSSESKPDVISFPSSIPSPFSPAIKKQAPLAPLFRRPIPPPIPLALPNTKAVFGGVLSSETPSNSSSSSSSSSAPAAMAISPSGMNPHIPQGVTPMHANSPPPPAVTVPPVPLNLLMNRFHRFHGFQAIPSSPSSAASSSSSSQPPDSFPDSFPDDDLPLSARASSYQPIEPQSASTIDGNNSSNSNNNNSPLLPLHSPPSTPTPPTPVSDSPLLRLASAPSSPPDSVSRRLQTARPPAIQLSKIVAPPSNHLGLSSPLSPTPVNGSSKLSVSIASADDVDKDVESIMNNNNNSSSNSSSNNNSNSQKNNNFHNLCKWTDIGPFAPFSGPSSLGFLPPRHPLRYYLQRFITHNWTEWTVILLILLSSVTMALENPRMSESDPILDIIHQIDVFVTAAFALEALIKIIAFGFAFHKGSYLRSSWNLIDFGIVIVSVLSLAVQGSGIKSVRILRMLRTLRPLRFIQRNPGMRLVVSVLFSAIPSIGDVLLVTIILILVFSIVGVQLLAGKMYSCSDPSIVIESACTGFFSSPTTAEVLPRVWMNGNANFDNIGAGTLSLFRLMSQDDWPNVAFAVMDAKGIGFGPQQDYNQPMVFFIVAWIIVGSFFLLNLFVGVLLDQYDKLKQRHAAEGGTFLMTESQRKWRDMQRTLLSANPLLKPRKPDTKFRRLFWRIGQSSLLDKCMSFAIVVNTIIMCLDHYNQSPSFDALSSISNYFFASIFTIEAAIKLIGFSPQTYFADAWSRFDFFVVVVSILGLFLDIGVGATVFRLFRLARLIKLIRVARGLRTLLMTLFLSIPSLINVAGLLLLLFFIYATLGVQLFATIDRSHGSVLVLSDRANFETFENAFLILFKMITSDSTFGIMYDCSVQPPFCNDDNSDTVGGCGDITTARIYFVSFSLLCSFIFINLFIGIVLEAFGDESSKTGKGAIDPEDVARFCEIWMRFDPQKTTWIDINILPTFIRFLGEPMGLEKDTPIREAVAFVTNLNIPEAGGRAHYKDVLIGLATRIVGVGEQLPEEVQRNMEANFMKIFRGKIPTSLKTRSLSEAFAAMRIQALVRGWLERHRLSKVPADSTDEAVIFARKLMELRAKMLRRVFANSPIMRSSIVGSGQAAAKQQHQQQDEADSGEKEEVLSNDARPSLVITSAPSDNSSSSNSNSSSEAEEQQDAGGTSGSIQNQNQQQQHLQPPEPMPLSLFRKKLSFRDDPVDLVATVSELSYPLSLGSQTPPLRSALRRHSSASSMTSLSSASSASSSPIPFCDDFEHAVTVESDGEEEEDDDSDDDDNNNGHHLTK